LQTKNPVKVHGKLRLDKAQDMGELRKDQSPRLKSLSFNRMIPNILTLLALCAGLTSIRYGLSDQWEQAVIALVIACILDGIDGRVARLLRGATKFGAELDSLSDAISFGVVPALLVYLWAMQHVGGIGWALCLLYVVCCVLRLARFNTMVGEPDLPVWAHSYFTGVPAPAAAGLTILPMILSFYFQAGIFNNSLIVGLFLLVVSYLMVSRVPTYSGKLTRLKTQLFLPLMILVGLTAAFLVTDPWATLSLMGLFYVSSIPISIFTFRRLSRRGGDDEKNE